jgi:N-acetyl-anhydromuramyl-L-alanine amidase AmpD
MAQSTEFPQFRWIPPKSWTNANRSYPTDIKWIVIHTTEGSEGSESAENGALYDQRRTDGTSAHFYVDSNSIVQCVKTADISHTARVTGNRHGIHIEICGRAGQSDNQWNDDVSVATLRQVALLCRTLLNKYSIPIVKLTTSQVASKRVGFCGHNNISDAFGESDHWDPGPNFPWSRLFDLIEEDGVSKEEVLDALTTSVPFQSEGIGNEAARRGVGNKSLRALIEYVWAELSWNNKVKIEEILTAISEDPNVNIVFDAEQIALLSEQISTRIPEGPSAQEIATAVGNEEAKRMQS